MSDELNEVWELYAEEGNGSLDEAEGILLKLRGGASDQAAIAALFRALHTFKGNARVMGLSVIESRAHLAEDLIGLVRDEGVPLDESLVNILLETVDVLRGMLENSLHDHRDVKPEPSEALADRLKLEYVRRREHGAIPPDFPPASPVVKLVLPGDPEWDVENEAPPAEQETAVSAQTHTGDDEVGALLFDDIEPVSLADDPLYRQIYADMVFHFLNVLREALPACRDDALTVTARLAEEAERVLHAASQMGFADWQQALEDYLALDFPGETDVVQTLQRLTAMADRDFADFAPAGPMATDHAASSEADIPYAENALAFFARLKIPLSALSAFSSGCHTDHPPAHDELLAILHQLSTICTEDGFPGPGVILDEYLSTLASGDFDITGLQDMEFFFYESLAALQRLSLTDVAELPLDADAILRLWCAERVEHHLLQIEVALDQLSLPSGDMAQVCAAIRHDLWRVYHACQHYGLAFADDLCMVLVDLFERVNAGEMGMGPALVTLTRSFIHCLTALFADIEEDRSPDLALLEQLLREAGDINFTLSDTHTPASVETRLQLPTAFHKVMTPESVTMAEQALARGDRFYILRVDLNAREELAGRFLEWMKSGAAEVVSNVTVFEGERSLFDFLIITRLDREDLFTALQKLDPEGRALCIEKVLLEGDEEKNETDAGHSAATDPVVMEPASKNSESGASDILEYIGELVTAQAVVMHLLSGMDKDDWARKLDAEMMAAGGDWSLARSTMRQHIDKWRDSVEKLLQVESRVNALLESLQESAIAMRTRPAGLLLKPLLPWLETLSRQHGKQVRLMLEGEDQSLDFSLLELLDAPLRSLLAFSALQSVESPEVRRAAGKSPEAGIQIGLIRAEDHLQLIIRDDGCGMLPGRIAARLEALGRFGTEPVPKAALSEDFGPFGNGDSDVGQLDFAALRESLRVHGGELYLANRNQGGLRISLTMPLAMVVMEGMVVKVGAIQYVIPIDTIQRIVHSGEGSLAHISADQGRKMLRLPGGDLLPVQYLMRNGSRPSRHHGVNKTLAVDKHDGYLFVVVGSTSQRVAVAVDELIGQQQVLIRPLQGYLSRIRGVMGCALLGSGEVGMVINIGYVIANEMRGQDDVAGQGG